MLGGLYLNKFVTAIVFRASIYQVGPPFIKKSFEAFFPPRLPALLPKKNSNTLECEIVVSNYAHIPFLFSTYFCTCVEWSKTWDDRKMGRGRVFPKIYILVVPHYLNKTSRRWTGDAADTTFITVGITFLQWAPGIPHTLTTTKERLLWSETIHVRTYRRQARKKTGLMVGGIAIGVIAIGALAYIDIKK